MSSIDRSSGFGNQHRIQQSAVNKQARIGADRTKPDSDQRTNLTAPDKRSWLNQQPKDIAEKEIRDLTRNPNTDAYDPIIAAKAIRENTTYNQAVSSTNVVNSLFGNSKRFEPVREMPWESMAVNGRVDQLMRDENLSFDATAVVAMTERPQPTSMRERIVDVVADFRGEAPTESYWEGSFAQMAMALG